MGEPEDDPRGRHGQDRTEDAAGAPEEPERTPQHEPPEEELLDDGDDEHRQRGDHGQVDPGEPPRQVLGRLRQLLGEPGSMCSQGR